MEVHVPLEIAPLLKELLTLIIHHVSIGSILAQSINLQLVLINLQIVQMLLTMINVTKIVQINYVHGLEQVVLIEPAQITDML